MSGVYTVERGVRGAPLLLMLHGIGSCADAFERQAPLSAATERRLVAWDAPGYRHSLHAPSCTTLDDWADAAAALIEELAYDQADVLGVSWGGVTATRLALRHPDLVRRLVLADSSTGSGGNPDSAAAMRARVDDIGAIGLARYAEDRAPRLLSPGADPELVRLCAVLMAESVHLDHYANAAASMAATDHGPDLASISVPTLVLVGDQDIVTPPERSVELADGIPGARLVVIRDAGHLANQEQPDAFNQAVTEFLTG